MLVSCTENSETHRVEHFQTIMHLWGVTAQLRLVESSTIEDTGK